MGQTSGPVRIVAAGPLHVAAFRAVGANPERQAFSELSAWARPLGLLDDPSAFMLFGRNDPPPEHEGDQYGYLYMLTLPKGVDVKGGGVEEDLPRATYATTRATLATIGRKWEELYTWAESQGYRVVGHGLEEHLSLPEGESVESLVLDLWLPVDERARRSRSDREHGGRG